MSTYTYYTTCLAYLYHYIHYNNTILSEEMTVMTCLPYTLFVIYTMIMLSSIPLGKDDCHGIVAIYYYDKYLHIYNVLV